VFTSVDKEVASVVGDDDSVAAVDGEDVRGVSVWVLVIIDVDVIVSIVVVASVAGH